MIVFVVCFVLSMTLGAPAFGGEVLEDCSERSVDTTHFPKNNDQQDLEWCFAYSAASILSFYEKTKLSAYDIALQFHNNDSYRLKKTNNKTTDYTITPGNASLAMATVLNEKGVCLESETNYTGDDWAALSQVFKTMASPDQSFQKLLCQDLQLKRNPLTETPKDIIKVLDKLSGEKRMAALLDVTCQKRHKISKDHSIYLMGVAGGYKTEDLMNKIDTLLENSEPVTIAYDASVLRKGPNYRGKNATHASVIVGRKLNPQTGSCEYLIKNTWGSENCTKHPDIPCKDGNYWIPRAALMGNLFEINYIENKKIVRCPQNFKWNGGAPESTFSEVSLWDKDLPPPWPTSVTAKPEYSDWA